MSNKRRVFVGIEQSYDGDGFVVTGCNGKNGLEYQEFLKLVHFLRDKLPHVKKGENQTTIFEDANDLYKEIGSAVNKLYLDDEYDVFVRPLGAKRIS